MTPYPHSQIFRNLSKNLDRLWELSQSRKVDRESFLACFLILEKLKILQKNPPPSTTQYKQERKKKS